MVIAVLTHPIPFGAPDGKPVDIVCFILSSSAMLYLDVMKDLSLAFTQKELAKKLRGKVEKKEILNTLGIEGF
jgi:mannitol/fructose-specific phosphotransferase system IIA component (Ntr-type)